MGRKKEADRLKGEVKRMSEKECKDTFGKSKEEMNKQIANDQYKK